MTMTNGAVHRTMPHRINGELPTHPTPEWFTTMALVTNAPGYDEQQFGVLQEMAANVLTSRLDWLFKQAGFDRRRSIDDECGIPRGELSPQDYLDLHLDDPYAARSNEVYAKEMWQVTPKVYESEDPDSLTQFDKDLQELAKTLRGQQSWLESDESHPLWEHLVRLDVASGINRYGIMLFGINDGQPLHIPVRGVMEEGSEPSEPSKLPASESTDDGTYKELLPPPIRGRMSRNEFNKHPRYKLTLNIDVGPPAPNGKVPRARKPLNKLTQLRVFTEALAPIIQWETNPRSPRYGHPVMYRVTFEDPVGVYSQSTNMPSRTVDVHWTRVLHVCDTFENPATPSEVFAEPRNKVLRKVLLSFPKLLYAGAEGYFKACVNLLALETIPALGGNVRVDRQQIRDMMENVMNSLQRYLVGTGFTFKSIAPNVTDPTPHIEAHINTICIKKGIPVRVFKGSERGELASTQDDAAWNDRLKGRMQTYATPKLVAPTIDRLIMLGIISKPASEKYRVEWPDLTSETSGEKLEVAKGVVTVITDYVSKGGESIMAPKDLLTRVLWFEDAEADAILEAAEEHIEEKDEKEMLKQEEQIERGVLADPTGPKPDAMDEDMRTIDMAQRIRPAAKEPSVNELLKMWDYEEWCPVVNAKGSAKKKLSGGQWVTLDNGVKVYLKSGRVVVGPAPVKEAMETPKRGKDGKPKEGKKEKHTVESLSSKARDSLRAASDADKAGDHEAARHHRAAAHGYNRAAAHLEDGDHEKARAVAMKADDFAQGRQKLKPKEPEKKDSDKAKADSQPPKKKPESPAPAPAPTKPLSKGAEAVTIKHAPDAVKEAASKVDTSEVVVSRGSFEHVPKDQLLSREVEVYTKTVERYEQAYKEYKAGRGGKEEFEGGEFGDPVWGIRTKYGVVVMDGTHRSEGVIKAGGDSVPMRVFDAKDFPSFKSLGAK